MITDQQHKQIEQWVCSPQYKQIEPQIVDGCVEFLNHNPPYCGWEDAFEAVCCELITSKQTNFDIYPSIWQWVWSEICHTYGDNYYPKMIKQRQMQMAINTDFE